MGIARLVAVVTAVGLAAATPPPDAGRGRGAEPAVGSAAPAAGQLLGAAPAGAGGRPFSILTEVYGDGAATARDRLVGGLADGVTLHPPLSQAERDLVAGTELPFVYFSVPDEAGVARCYPETTDPRTADTLAELGRTSGRAWRLGTPELDQSGGCWAEGRPDPEGLGDGDAYESWMRYYRETKGLASSLGAGVAERGYQWMTLCGFAFCPQYAYELGSDAVLLERNNDEVSGLSPGLAFVRGAAAQNGGKTWGIDMSTYRYWTGGPTEFDGDGTLLTGWSPSTFERHMYAAYMAGADLIQNEAADYVTGGPPGGLNPLGETVRSFADFSLVRHPDRGEPHVPFAVVQDHLSGYEPRYGAFDQVGQKWYKVNPYTAGDRMLDGLLAFAYPGHERWGTIVPGAPWNVPRADGVPDVAPSQAAQRRLLAAGADPRQWEPMGATRWGESLDVLTDRAPLEALLRYPVVVLSTSAPAAAPLAAHLEDYVRRGGTLVLNARQLPADAERWTGVRPTDRRGEAVGGTWLPDGAPLGGDRPFGYLVAESRGSDVVAATSGGDPLVTRAAHGDGVVYVTTADPAVDDGVTAADGRLLDELYRVAARVLVDGPPLQYLVNAEGPRTLVTLVNTDVTGRAWRGTLRFPGLRDGTVRELTGDSVVAGSDMGGVLGATVTVPPYGVRVFEAGTSG